MNGGQSLNSWHRGDGWDRGEKKRKIQCWNSMIISMHYFNPMVEIENIL
jgi:hypothetical protein